ncbi:MAG: hypothetical protein H6R26_814 [Proteobacteria bacterium]|nr:hypothetical protein [Pseudomonadota bacterium]
MKYEKGLYFINELGTINVTAFRLNVDGQWIKLKESVSIPRG